MAQAGEHNRLVGGSPGGGLAGGSFPGDTPAEVVGDGSHPVRRNIGREGEGAALFGVKRCACAHNGGYKYLEDLEPDCSGRFEPWAGCSSRG